MPHPTRITVVPIGLPFLLYPSFLLFLFVPLEGEVVRAPSVLQNEQPFGKFYTIY
jgi:hypothetical protein